MTLLLTAVAAAIVLIAIYITAVEPYWFRTVRLDVRSPRVPAGLEGRTVLFLTDIHTSKYGRLEKTLSRRLRELGQVDLCVITGDLMYRGSAGGALARVLENVDARSGKYYVCGNSEYKPYIDHDEMITAYGNMGLTELRNRSVTPFPDAPSFRLVGVDNFEECDVADPAAAFEEVRDTDYTVCLSHAPSNIDGLLKYGPDLVLSGHTHGGQVRLPLFNVVYTHMSRLDGLHGGMYPPDRLSELAGEKTEKTLLIVSNGIGTSAIRIRFRCRPQIHILTFYQK
ncbi:MAG: metallophosphoesterase [Abditibacteriota bacterium]|nr:metallophosphoesterase [Abditibacteriota bacterium]